MDRTLGLFLVLGAALLYFLIAPAQVSMPRVRLGEGGAFFLSPLFFPRLVAVGLAFLGFLLLLRGLPRADALRDGEGIHLPRRGAARAAGAVLILVLYIVSLGPVGYLVVTPLALMGLMLLLGARGWGSMLGVALGTTAAIYLGFQWGMLIILPEGIFY